MNTFGPAFDISLDGDRVLTQLEVIRDVLLSAAECAEVAAVRMMRAGMPPEDGGWMTLRDLGELTGYGEASISAQIRHLRKEQFGGYLVAKRRRGLEKRGVWEYRILGRGERAVFARLFVGMRM
jgi:biotin operon repressor